MTSSRESLWAVAPEDRPRERLVRLGPAELTDAELVALVLGSGMPGVNVLDSARSLLSQAGGVTELMTMTVGELKALIGVGVATAGRVVAVAELWRRANDPPPGMAIKGPEHLVDAVRAFLDARAETPSPAARARAEGVRTSGTGHAPAPGPVSSGRSDEGKRRYPVGEQADDEGGAADHDALGAAAYDPPRTLIVIADSELRLRVVVALATTTGSAGPATRSGVPSVPAQTMIAAVLHEVLYRGGAAFGIAEVAAERGPDDDSLRANRDVLKLAAATVGLRYLSTVVVTPEGWSLRD